jgi:hypothetical protein
MTRKPWVAVWVVAALVLLALGLGVSAWWQYYTYLPPLPERTVLLPTPNARDDFIAATLLLPATSALGRFSQKPLSLPELRQAVAAGAPAIRRMRGGYGKEFLNPTPPFEEPIPELSGYRRLGRLLAGEARLERARGEYRRAANLALEAMRFGNTIPRGGGVIHGLVGAKCEEMALLELARVAGMLAEQDAECAAQELLRLDESAVSLAAAIAIQRDAELPFVASVLRGKDPNDHVRFLWAWNLFTPQRQSLAQFRAYFDEWVRWAEQPAYARPAEPQPHDRLTGHLGPNFSYDGLHWTRLAAKRRVVATRLALRAFEVREQRLPNTLSQLVPRYLPAVPQDPFAPIPLIYRVVRNRPLVYSCGPDGDDDGGQFEDKGGSSGISYDVGSDTGIKPQ